MKLSDSIPSSNEVVECDGLEIVSSDARRDIREAEFVNSSFQDFLVKADVGPLGQHFHRRKFEVFYFLAGGGTVSTALADSDGRIVGDVRRFEVKQGTAIHIPPMHTHRFDLKTGTRFVVFSSTPFDPGDLIACPIA